MIADEKGHDASINMPMQITIPFTAYEDVLAALQLSTFHIQERLDAHLAESGLKTMKDRTWATQLDSDLQQIREARAHLKGNE